MLIECVECGGLVTFTSPMNRGLKVCLQLCEKAVAALVTFTSPMNRGLKETR